MNSMDILDAIGKVDDILIKRAKENQKSHKAVWAAIGTIAACFFLIITLPIVLVAFRGASSAAPENTYNDNDKAAGADYVYLQIDVASHKDKWSFFAYDSLKTIHEAIVDITANTESEGSKIQSESVTDNSPSSTTKGTDSFVSEPKEGEYIITLRHHDGGIISYRLTDMELTDMDTGVSYPLTKEQSEYLISLIKK